MLADVYSLVLFQFSCFALFIGSFLELCTKSMYSGPTMSCVNHVKHWSVVCSKHTFMPCWIAVQYVVRVLYFSASSLFISLSSYSFICYSDNLFICWAKFHWSQVLNLSSVY